MNLQLCEYHSLRLTPISLVKKEKQKASATARPTRFLLLYLPARQVCGSDEDGDVMLLCDHCDQGCSFGMGKSPNSGTGTPQWCMCHPEIKNQGIRIPRDQGLVRLVCSCVFLSCVFF